MPRTLDQFLNSFDPKDRAEVESDAARIVDDIRAQQRRAISAAVKTTTSNRSRPFRDRSGYPCIRHV